MNCPLARRQGKTCFFTAAAFAFLLGLIFCPLADGRGGGGGGYVTITPQPPLDPRILIDSVDLVNSQVTIVFMRDGLKHVYTVDGGTNITVYGKSATLKDITANLEVKEFVERDSNTLDSITVDTASPKPELPPPPQPSQ